jgi:DNA polymerase
MRTLFQDYEFFYGPVEIDGPVELNKRGKPKKPKTLNLSLRNTKLSMTDLIRHPAFDLFGASLKWEDEPKPRFYRAGELKNVYGDVDWKNTRVVAHNAMLEGIINFEKFGVVPGAYFCTMACAEALFQGSVQVGLDTLARMFGIGQKLDELHKFKGLRAKDLTEEQWTALAAYCNHDIALTEPLYNALAPSLPQAEHQIMNHTIMMYANPVLRVDLKMAHEALAEAEEKRATLIAATGLTDKQIGSNGTFASVLKGKLGWIPQKVSKKTGKLTYAFAKTDKEFAKLKSHTDESVRNLVLARQEVKSPTIITRTTRVIRTGTTGTEFFPVALHYSRAHTMRWAGGDRVNIQAWNRKSKLRKSLIAPPGYVIVVVDSAQIECRTLASIAGQEDLLQMFLNGEDPYNHMAMLVFGGGPYDKDSDERFMGKTMVLGLGYGMGAPKFHNEIVTGARGRAMPITLEFADRAVKIYRGANDKICGVYDPMLRKTDGGFWQYADSMIEYLTHGDERREFMDGMVTLDPAVGKVIFPNGTFLRYAELTCDEGDYVYKSQKKGKYVWKKIYGGLFTENLAQKIARDIVATQCSTVAQRYRWVLSTHDEGGFLARKEEAAEALAFAVETFRTNLPYTNIPLNAEGAYATFYSK